MAAKRKVSKKAPAKKATPKKAAAPVKPKTPRARKPSAEDRELHYSDLRKVMLASVLKRLK